MTRVTTYGRPATRRRIIEAAWALLEQEGPDFTMADVAARAGVSRQAVYLHVGGRTGLLHALVDHMDEVQGLGELAAQVHAAPDAVTALRRMVSLHATYHERIIAAARIFDAHRHRDAAVASAWEDRMAGRRATHRSIVQRLSDEGRLADGWDVETAALLFYTVTLPRTWDELVAERGWTTAQYAEHMTRLLERALVRRG